MTAKQTTNLVVAGATVGLLAYELWTLANRESGDTISESINELGNSQPLTTIAVGACAVHFAGGLPALQKLCSRRPMIALGIGALVGAAWPLKGLKTS